MGILNWIIFWNDNRSHSVIYHVVRQVSIISLFIFAVFFLPSFPTIYLLSLSLIEYTRKCSGICLVTLYIFVLFVTWFTGFLIQPFEDHLHPRITVLDLLRGAMYVMAIVFDRLTAKRFGIVSNITLFSFPIFLTCSAEFIAVIDHFGTSIHVSSFCNTFSDLTFLPLRLIGPSGVAFAVGFFASYTSMWRVARYLGRRKFRIHIRVFPIIIVAIVVFNIFFVRKETSAKAIVIENFNNTDSSKIQKLIKKVENNPEFIIIDMPITGDISPLLSTKTKSLLAFCHSSNKTDTLYVVTHNGTTKFPLVHHQKSKVPFLYKMQKILVLNTTLGRTAFLVGRDILFAEFFASQPVDLIISFGASEYDEKAGLMTRVGSIISSTTGAYHFHTSGYSKTYLVRGNGHWGFTANPDNKEIREFDIYASQNKILIGGNKLIFFAFFFHVLGSLWIILNFLPYLYVRNITQLPRGVVMTIQDSTM